MAHFPSGEPFPVGKNNQDAYGFTETDSYTLAVVADGCGSGEHSEFGAALAVQRLIECTNLGFADVGLFNRELNQVLKQAYGLFEPGGKTVNDYFLFTILGILHNKLTSTVEVFGCGDGVYSTAGRAVVIKPPNNAPNYMGYNLLSPGKCGLTVHERGWESEMLPAIVGTDGLADYPNWETEYPGWVEKNANLTRVFRKSHGVLRDDTTAVGIGF